MVFTVASLLLLLLRETMEMNKQLLTRTSSEEH